MTNPTTGLDVTVPETDPTTTDGAYGKDGEPTAGATTDGAYGKDGAEKTS